MCRNTLFKLPRTEQRQALTTPNIDPVTLVERQRLLSLDNFKKYCESNLCPFPKQDVKHQDACDAKWRAVLPSSLQRALASFTRPDMKLWHARLSTSNLKPSRARRDIAVKSALARARQRNEVFLNRLPRFRSKPLSG